MSRPSPADRVGRRRAPDRRGRARPLAAASLALTAVGLIGLAVLPAPPAAAARQAPLTVAWAGGNSADLQQYQPERDRSAIHYNDFKDVRVTVAKTRDLVDEAIGVTVTGMPGPTQSVATGAGTITMGVNFVQAMQCWGDPTDPEFYKNCLYGAWSVANTSTPGRPGVNLNVTTRGGSSMHNVPFRDAVGREYASTLDSSRDRGLELAQVVRPETANERAEFVDGSGTAQFLFETQSAASQPYLGCGDEATGALRCWLVIVPRGLHASAASDECLITAYPRNVDKLQQNSPVNPHCDYWANRLVVPLDFRTTGSTCPPGSVERLVIGSEAAAAAFASWQAGLCQSTGAAYAFTSGSDVAVRGQLLSGQAHMAITARPLTEQYLLEGSDPEQLAEADLVYAPVAVSGAVIAFLANYDGVRHTDIRLSPRLLAKMMTHSYQHEQGLYWYASQIDPGPWSTNPTSLWSDPEFRALNPGASLTEGGSLVMTGPNSADAIAQLWAYLQADDAARAFLSGEPDNVLPGDEANSGMTINPYYLPKGHPDAKVPVFEDGQAWDSGQRIYVPALVAQRDAGGRTVWRQVGLANADGSPLCLCDAPVDAFMKADETQLPPMLIYPAVQYRYDILQARPYAANLAAAARMVFRGDKGSKTLWDPAKMTAVGVGDWASDGLSRQDSVFVAGFTDAAGAARYGLATAALQLPNQRDVFVRADSAGLTAALAAQIPSQVAGVTMTDPAQLPNNAYPLTSVLYAAVNLAGTDQAARDQYADLISYAVVTGQVTGGGIGELPEGYLPLPDNLWDQALAAVQTVRDYLPPDGDPDDVDPDDVDPDDTDPDDAGRATLPNSSTTAGASRQSLSQSLGSTAGNTAPADGTSGSSVDAPSGPAVVYTQAEAVAAAQTASTATPARAALAAPLAVGAAGLVAGPLLLRRRREVRP
ncbi:MAG: hypothetical protein LBG60_02010 [Bifidobacteriaceae bacterium]|jgi:hypothetical protein|nr:hypothetical protein [Bifidobacteriaceae bacterium]